MRGRTRRQRLKDVTHIYTSSHVSPTTKRDQSAQGGNINRLGDSFGGRNTAPETLLVETPSAAGPS